VTEPEPLQGHLDRVVRGMGAPGVDAVEVVFRRWDEVVGVTLANRAHPVAIRDHQLILESDEPAIVSHVRYLEPQLLTRLAELLGPGRITGVTVRVRRR
jgi:predicted nucleic acid-binding Zn ribbon protein